MLPPRALVETSSAASRMRVIDVMVTSVLVRNLDLNTKKNDGFRFALPILRAEYEEE